MNEKQSQGEKEVEEESENSKGCSRKTKHKLPDREMTDLYVMKETFACSSRNCVPCSYKIILHAGIHGTSCAPNERPENCLRIKSNEAAGGQKDELGIYKSTDCILTVGDGDFSFSLSLARAFCMKEKSNDSSLRINERLVATSHESKQTLLQVYPDVKPVLEELTSRGVLVLHEVDGTCLEGCPQLGDKQFTRIIWNFPCKGRGLDPGQDGQNKEMEENKNLVRQFCKSAERLLCPWGEVHLTHKTKPPFGQWGIPNLGSQTSRLVFKGSVVFDRSSYRPYTNRKALDRKSFPIFDSETFIFSKPLILTGRQPAPYTIAEPTLPTKGHSLRISNDDNNEASEKITVQPQNHAKTDDEQPLNLHQEAFHRESCIEPLTSQMVQRIRINLVQLNKNKNHDSHGKGKPCLPCQQKTKRFKRFK